MGAPPFEAGKDYQSLMSDHEFKLDWRKQWDLFTTQKHIYQDGVWLEIDNIAALDRKPKLVLQFFQDWQKMDWYCWHDGIIGWFCAVELENPAMQRCLLGVGAKEWKRDERYVYFYKHTIDAPETITFHEFNQRCKAHQQHAPQPVEEAHVEEPTV